MNNHNLPLGQIAVIDDTPANLHLLSHLLESAGYDVRAFPRGQLGIEGISYSPPDLILLDIQMPDMDGYQVCEQLKDNELTNSIPIIFISALTETFDKVKAFQLGGVDYINKPFQAEEVLVRVATHLEMYQMKKSLQKTNAIQSQQIIAQNRQLIQLNKALQKTNRELQDNYSQLQEAQLQLVQTEKMATLGSLVAGIGHEINNPLGCLQGNVDYLREYVEGLLSHVKLYEREGHRTSRIEDHAKEIELDFLQADLPNLLKSVEEGIDRIGQISTSLRIFSRNDSIAKVPFNLHDGLESSLLILKHRLKANQNRPEIQVIKRYGDLPEIDCFPGPLNQVFMNLLANAIDALDECVADRSDEEMQIQALQIEIETELEDATAIVRIRDNGVGISETIQHRIFEQGFTTKAVGKGTGLGMAIADEIVTKKHGGKITCNSQLGQGTEFTLFLPLS